MAAVMEVELILPLAAAAAGAPIVPLALSHLTLAQHTQIVALPYLVPHTPTRRHPRCTGSGRRRSRRRA